MAINIWLYNKNVCTQAITLPRSAMLRIIMVEFYWVKICISIFYMFYMSHIKAPLVVRKDGKGNRANFEESVYRT